MKVLRLVVFLSVCVLVTSVRAQSDSARQSEGVVGPVHVVGSESVSARRDGDRLVEEGRPRPHDTVTFDANGNFSQREVIDDYGYPVGRQTYTYQRGRLIEAMLADPKGARLERRRFCYASDDSVQSLAITGPDGSGYIERYARGTGGRLETVVYLVKGREIGKTVFTYEGPVDMPTTVAFFDDKGRRATAPVGPCLGAHRLQFRYANGVVEERVLYEEDGSVKRRSNYRYDDRGNVIQELRTDGSANDRFTYEYEYDSRGNWTRRISTRVYGSPLGRASADVTDIVTITRRTITYY
jgi:hypothetical protein